MWQRRCQLKFPLPITGNASQRGVSLDAEPPGDETLPTVTLTVSMTSGYETNYLISLSLPADTLTVSMTSGYETN